MPVFDLRNQRGRTVGQVIAADAREAVASLHARALGAVEAVAPGSMARFASFLAETPAPEESEDRLAEAFGRLGLSEAEVRQAVGGRSDGRSPGFRAAVETPEEKALAQRRWASHRNGAASRWERLDLANRLVAAGHTPSTAAYVAGAPPEGQPGLPSPADVLTAGSPPASTSESARPAGDGELVPLVERVDAAIRRVFR